MPIGRLALAVLAVVAALAPGGCGGGHEAARAPTAASRPTLPPSDLALPANVPDRPTGPADRASARVVRRWLRALSRGDVQGAARFFALPSRYQNGTAVLTIDSPGERLAINLALPCGGRVVALRGARGFTIATIRLRERPGADCGRGAGGRARTAIRVAGGRIREWYRLPDRPGGPQTAPPAPSGPVA
jgi:hypothetical protein